MVAVVALVLVAVSLTFSSAAAAVSITVPYSSVPVATGDLDGYPGTGAWGDALSVTVPLENGEAAPYGSATLYAKHDGTSYYFRIDGKIDAPWTSTSGTYFWLGMVFSPTGSSHHAGSGTWDGIFFGLWDSGKGLYTPTPTYPPSVVDTNGFSKPPAQDGTQDASGAMRYSGTGAPYDFTAEWKRGLSTGDANDITFVADGTTTYNFFVTTDSDGGGSSGGVSGGTIDHSAVSNTNTMRFASSLAIPEFPSIVSFFAAVVGTFGIVVAVARRRSRAQ